MAALLTAAQVAARWQVSAATVNRYARTGVVPAVRVGGSWRFAEHAVEAYERRQSTAAATVEQPVSAARPALTVVDSLPDGYEPIFPALWGREPTATAAASPAARRGVSASKKTARQRG